MNWNTDGLSLSPPRDWGNKKTRAKRKNRRKKKEGRENEGRGNTKLSCKGSFHLWLRWWGCKSLVPLSSHRECLLHHLTPCHWKWDPLFKAATSGCCYASCSALRSWPGAPHWALGTWGVWPPRHWQRTGPARLASCSQTCRLKPKHRQKCRERMRRTPQLW